MLEHITDTPLTILQQRHPSLPAILSALPSSHLSALQSMVNARASGQPLLYLIGDTTFCSLNLLCRPPTLIPRPETEQMTAWLIHTVRQCPPEGYSSSTAWPADVPFHDSAAVTGPPARGQSPLRVLDLCTGSGCIALALAAHLHCEVVGVDISDSALTLARDNAAHVAGQVTGAVKAAFVKGDVRAGQMPREVEGEWDVVVSNPPYVRRAEVPGLQREVAAWEDWGALDGGEDGLAFYAAVVGWAGRRVSAGSRGWPQVVLEIGGEEQVEAVSAVCAEGGFGDVRVYTDHYGKQRWVAARRKGDG